ncbi:MAG: tripartite tricarboxylate transporter substrate binding protein [Betaproteobacteria bacterium]|nr:MAG: tripartite tricarboxylate transporter substrate binding protein [Betaproteobacteria bacterium]
MKLRVCRLLAIVAFGVSFASSAIAAEAYPTKPVRMIIPFGAGGSTDVLVRIVATRMSGVLGQQVVIDNRTGAGSLIGTEIAAKSNPDGYTLLGTGTPFVIVPNLYKKAPFHPVRSFAPIMQMASQPYGLVVHPSLPVKSVKDLIALAKKEPGKLDYASSGQGGAMHLFQALFVNMAGLDMVHVPYKGSGPVRSDLLGGQIKIGCIGLSSIINHHRAGQLRIIAVTTAKRSPALPDIPSIGETVRGYDAALWTGLVAPRGTPASVIERIHREVAKLLKTPEVEKAYERLGTDIVATDPAAFGKFVAAENAKWGKVVRDLKLVVK